MLTNYIRAAVSGKTVDGREITEQQIQEMADTYAQDVYSARIWAEHIRGIMPGSLFKALGDVVSVTAKRISEGALSGRLALFVQLSPLPELVDMVRNGEKVHLSVEIDPAFADTGKAYLVGLGVTDSPASIGTGIMKFNLEARHQNLFSTPESVDLNSIIPQSEPHNYSQEFSQLFTQIKNLSEDVAAVRAELVAIKEQGADTNTIVTEIGEFSAGRFKRNLATGRTKHRDVNY